MVAVLMETILHELKWSYKNLTAHKRKLEKIKKKMVMDCTNTSMLNDLTNCEEVILDEIDRMKTIIKAINNQ